MSKEYVPVKIRKQIDGYIKDPDTIVSIIHNKDTGKWLWSVVVVDSDEFWLDAFKTCQGARSYN